MAHIYFEEGDSHKALKNHFSALRIREKTGDTYGAGNSYDNIAHIYSSQYRYQDALKYFMRSFKTFKKMKNLSRETLSSANVGLQLYRQGNYPAALLCYYNSLENYNKMNNEEGIAWMQRSIGEVLAESNNIEKALEYYNESLSIEQKLNNSLVISEIYILIRKAYIALEDFPKSLEFQHKSLEISELLKDPEGIVRAYYFIAKTNLLTGNLDQALLESQTSIDLAVKHEINYYIPLLSTQIGEIKLKLNNPKEAKKWLVSAVEKHKEMEAGTNLFVKYRLLSEAELNNFQQAFQYQKMSVESFEKLETQKTSQLASQYETDKKESLLKSQQEQKDLVNAQELNKKQRQRNTAIVGLILMASIAVTLLYLFRLRSKRIKIENKQFSLIHKEDNLLEKLQGYLYSFESFAHKKELNFRVEVSNRAKPLLEDQLWSFSHEALQIIVSNLLSNAIKFSPPKGKIITTIDFDE